MEDTNEKLCTVNGASQNNHIRKFIQEPCCVYGYMNTHAHVCMYTRYTHSVYVFVCVLFTLHVNKFKHLTVN